jgi:hypothetical protein
MTLFDFRNYRNEFGSGGGNGAPAKPGRWTLPKAASIRFLFELSEEHRTGKV